MAVHELKSWREYYAPLVVYSKRFEIRRADREFAVGDYLVLREFDPDTNDGEGTYTGRAVVARVRYVLEASDEAVPGFLMRGFVVMDIDLMGVTANSPKE
jgi:hypothetical protein